MKTRALKHMIGMLELLDKAKKSAASSSSGYLFLSDVSI